MNSLNTVESFGAVDADSDDLLLQSFEDHEAFDAIKSFQRFLVIGRKGSGKTAIFKHMLKRDRGFDYFCFGHTFSDYPWYLHDKQEKLGVPDSDKFTHSWKYLILLTASKIALNQDTSLPCDERSLEDMAKLESFVMDTYGTKDPDITQIFTLSKRLKLKPHFEFDVKLLKAGISPEDVPMEELPSIVPEVNHNLLSCVLNCLNPDHEYFICFDQLDLGFDPDKPDYKNRLTGLLLACRDINLAAKEKGKKLFVVVFLRDDIYETLHFEDKNKITENFVSTIRWDDNSSSSKTLKQLMEKRFTVVLSDSGEAETVRWDDVFDETKEMSSRQNKYSHIRDRTYLRPRDMIKFCNLALERHKVRSQAGKTSTEKIENIDINEARTDYSEYLRSELDDEIYKHLPEYEQYLELLRLVGTWQFDKETFEEIHNTRLGTSATNPETVLQSMYKYSLIGFYRTGGRGYGGSEYIFQYQNYRTLFDAKATSVPPSRF